MMTEEAIKETTQETEAKIEEKAQEPKPFYNYCAGTVNVSNNNARFTAEKWTDIEGLATAKVLIENGQSKMDVVLLKKEAKALSKLFEYIAESY